MRIPGLDRFAQKPARRAAPQGSTQLADEKHEVQER
jgi:hypothetical protein